MPPTPPKKRHKGETVATTTTLVTLEDRLEDVLRISDPRERFLELKALGDEAVELATRIRRARGSVVRELRDRGLTWAQVGDRLGISGSRAEQLDTRD